MHISTVCKQGRASFFLAAAVLQSMANAGAFRLASNVKNCSVVCFTLCERSQCHKREHKASNNVCAVRARLLGKDAEVHSPLL
uniref:Putative secreted protein n=1 Tax=Ixodes ricinus TaxID=34613 RepID=A0A6B0UE87_IXORI